MLKHWNLLEVEGGGGLKYEERDREITRGRGVEVVTGFQMTWENYNS